MRTTMSKILFAMTFAAVLCVAGAGAEAQCVKKAGQGTGSNLENAKFQAWEAVLQATDWGSWASFMSASGKLGSAPGYKVSGLTSKCKPGGLGQECVVQATLCK
jgi:hypothetical protein